MRLLVFGAPCFDCVAEVPTFVFNLSVITHGGNRDKMNGCVGSVVDVQRTWRRYITSGRASHQSGEASRAVVAK